MPANGPPTRVPSSPLRGWAAVPTLALLALVFLTLAAAGCGHGSPAAVTSSGSPHASSHAQPAPTALQVQSIGAVSAVLRTPHTVRFRFRFTGEAPAVWNWRVVGYYGGVMASGVSRTGAATGSVSWDCTAPDGKVASPGEYIVKIGPGDRYRAIMTKVGWVRFEPPVQARVYTRLPAAGRRVALTFDDGGGKTAWYWILRELTAGHAKGTFFPIGLYVGDYAAREARLTLKDHMAIGNHTWSHPDLTTVSDAEVRSQLVRDEQVWWRGLRACPAPYLRPPDGDYNAHLLDVAGKLGYSRIVMWDIDAGDAARPRISVQAIVHNVVDNVRPGSIVLMHIRGYTPKALPLIIKGLRARHYQMVTIPELFEAAGIR